MLDRMAELFEVPVSVLLGGGLEVEEEQPSELNEIAQQLAVLNDQLVQQAVRRRKVIRYAFVGVFAAIFVLIGAAIGLRVYTESQLRDEASLRTVRYECTLDGESYVYEAMRPAAQSSYILANSPSTSAFRFSAFFSSDACFSLAELRSLSLALSSLFRRVSCGEYPRSDYLRRCVPTGAGADCQQTQTAKGRHNADFFRAGKVCGLRLVAGIRRE